MVTQFTENSIKESTKPIIIKAFASWCQHCAKMKPIFEQLENELGQKYMFTEFDVDEFPELTQHYTVTSSSYLYFYKR